ncbi:MAG: cysteine--tRNA ligase [bacterium]
MQIYLNNSLRRKVEAFAPLKDNEVRMYSCGPTVYNFAHIGNMRAFLFADLLQRVLKIVGEHKVRWVMNITNIDDKTIRYSAIGSSAWLDEMGKQSDNSIENLLKLTEYYEKSFLDDIGKLGINTNDFSAMPKATEYIKPMQDLIKSILEKGFAYISEGSIYFNVAEWRKHQHYGRLFYIDFENFRAGTRIDSDQYEREDVSDFVLWKARKQNEPFWNFEIDGQNFPGRPGWHIECSCMEKELLGLPFDIHTGGIDLKFPHHEDEIAQSHAGYGIDPTVMWCHNEFLEVEGQKMSKSLGNFFTLRDLLDKGIDPLDIRYSMFASHYGSVYNFTFDGIKAGHKARFRVQEYIYKLFEISDGDIKVDVESLKNSAFKELANDLHTPKSLAHLFRFINDNPAERLSSESKNKLIEFFAELNEIFAVWQIAEKQELVLEIPSEIKEKAEMRLAAKKNKDWALADSLRNEITDAGYVLKDTKDGYVIEKE